MVKPFRLSTISPAPGMHPSDSSYIQQIALALQTISHQLADINDKITNSRDVPPESIRRVFLDGIEVSV